MKHLFLTGGDPFEDRNLKWFVKCFGQKGLLTVMFIFMILQNIQNVKNKEMLQFCGVGAVMTMYLVVSFMLCVMLYYQSTFREIITKIKEDYEYTQTLSPDEQKVVVEYAAMGQKVSKYWTCLVYVAALGFPVQAIALTTYYTVTDEFRLVDLFEFKYPARIEEFMGPVITAIVVNVSTVYFEYCCTCEYVGVASLGPSFMLHACGKIELVERHVKVLFSENGNSPSETKRKLNEIVKQIQDIYRYVNKIYYLFVSFLINCFIQCFILK